MKGEKENTTAPPLIPLLPLFKISFSSRSDIFCNISKKQKFRIKNKTLKKYVSEPAEPIVMHQLPVSSDYQRGLRVTLLLPVCE